LKKLVYVEGRGHKKRREKGEEEVHRKDRKRNKGLTKTRG